MHSSLEEVEQLHESSSHQDQPRYQLSKQPSFISSPRPSRSTSNTTLAQSFKAQSSFPIEANDIQPAALSGSDRFDFPNITSLHQSLRVNIENQWPPKPYGVENLPQYSFEANRRLSHRKSSSLSNCSKGFKKKLNDSVIDSTQNYNDLDFNLLSSSNLNLGQLIGSAREQDKFEHLNRRTLNRITQPPSITLTLFENWNNPDINWKTKFKSFTATVFINFLLPFTNGVMLGFGEIAAKEILGNFFGWGPAAHRYHNDNQINQRLPLNQSSSSLFLNSHSNSHSNSSTDKYSDSNS